MTVISRSVPAFASGGYAASNGNDNDYSTTWRSIQVPSVSSPKWLAYNLSGVPAAKRGQVVVWWANNYTSDYLNATNAPFYTVPKNYTLQANAAPGGASAPTSGWVTLTTVTENTFPVRTHSLDLSGYNWIRMSVTASRGGSGNNDVSFQMDVFDASQGSADSWIILGDSLTQEGLLPLNIDGSAWTGGNLAQLVATARPERFPMIVHAGNGGMNMDWANANKAALLAPFAGEYVAINYGTNDANTGSPLSQAAIDAYYADLIAIVDYVESLGKTAVVPKIPWGCTASLAANAQALNNHVDANLFTARPNVVRGPDLYTYFQANQNYVRSDCLHLTYSAASGLNGYEQYQRLWRDAMIANVYGG
jgi:hypothetical protein